MPQIKQLHVDLVEPTQADESDDDMLRPRRECSTARTPQVRLHMPLGHLPAACRRRWPGGWASARSTLHGEKDHVSVLAPQVHMSSR